MIITTRYNSANQSYADNYLDCYAEKGKTTLIGGYYPDGGFCTTRNATVSNTKVSFGAGYFQTGAANDQCIPYKIYGIR